MSSEEAPPDELIEDLSCYLDDLYSCGTEAVELSSIKKRFPQLRNYSRILTKLGCTVLDDLVLLDSPTNLKY